MAKPTQKQLAELEAKWKRAVADYRNLEQRITKQHLGFVKFANASLISQLLAVLDDLERAKDHLPDQGLELIINRFTDVLRQEGVAEIKAANQPFDPQLMDCTDQVPGPNNQVVAVSLKGYTLNGQVLRPAKVTVGKGKS